MVHQIALVVDFGGQYSQLIVRRIRELGVYSELVPWKVAEARVRQQRPDAVILSGGPRSVLESGAPTIDLGVLDGIPTLGICYGMQLMAHQLGGLVESSRDREYGLRHLELRSTGRSGGVAVGTRPLVESLGSKNVWMSHGDQVMGPPPGFTVTAETNTCPVAAMESVERRLFGVQFHPEVTHTDGGKRLLREFLIDRAGLRGDWTSESFIDDAVAEVRAKVGDGKVLCAVSGGVDSSVLAALLDKAIGHRAVCVFVDHGLLRKGEAEMVERAFKEHFSIDLRVFDEKDRFFVALAGVTDPEEKRRIIGEQFVRVFDEHADELEDCAFLAQGTIYPDVVESGSETAAKIKSHHNVGGMPDWFKEKRTIVEPLRLLFKDEVREVGRRLGLPESMVARQPFPGPGLAVRILGEVTPERVATVQDADAIFREELRKAGLEEGIWQCYAALLDTRSVGVMGDERTYQHPIVLRAVESEDAMTARASRIPYEVLEVVSARIVNEVAGVNRVLYDLTTKPPATIEWE